MDVYPHESRNWKLGLNCFYRVPELNTAVVFVSNRISGRKISADLSQLTEHVFHLLYLEGKLLEYFALFFDDLFGGAFEEFGVG